MDREWDLWVSTRVCRWDRTLTFISEGRRSGNEEICHTPNYTSINSLTLCIQSYVLGHGVATMLSSVIPLQMIVCTLSMPSWLVRKPRNSEIPSFHDLNIFWYVASFTSRIMSLTRIASQYLARSLPSLIARECNLDIGQID